MTRRSFFGLLSGFTVVVAVAPRQAPVSAPRMMTVAEAEALMRDAALALRARLCEAQERIVAEVCAPEPRRSQEELLRIIASRLASCCQLGAHRF